MASNASASKAAHVPISVRPAMPGDVEIIADFNVAMAAETEDLQLDGWTVRSGVAAAINHEHRGFYFVALAHEHVAGCLLVTKEWSDWRNGEIWWVQSVYVTPEYRRLGVFRAMYDHVRDAARAAGSPGLRLYVEKDNTLAQNTYAAMGMKLTHYRVMEQMFEG